MISNRFGHQSNRKQRRVSRAGFSIIELLVVVAVIMIIAAIAIGSFTRAKMAANESAAVAALRAVATEEVNYDTSYSLGYSQTLAALGPPPPSTDPSPAAAGLIDPLLSSGTRSGYTFVYVPVDPGNTGSPSGYQVTASPIRPGITGQWYFYLDQTNIIRENESSPAGPTSAPIPR